MAASLPAAALQRGRRHREARLGIGAGAATVCAVGDSRSPGPLAAKGRPCAPRARSPRLSPGDPTEAHRTVWECVGPVRWVGTAHLSGWAHEGVGTRTRIASHPGRRAFQVARAPPPSCVASVGGSSCLRARHPCPRSAAARKARPGAVPCAWLRARSLRVVSSGARASRPLRARAGDGSRASRRNAMAALRPWRRGWAAAAPASSAAPGTAAAPRLRAVPPGPRQRRHDVPDGRGPLGGHGPLLERRQRALPPRLSAHGRPCREPSHCVLHGAVADMGRQWQRRPHPSERPLAPWTGRSLPGGGDRVGQPDVLPAADPRAPGCSGPGGGTGRVAHPPRGLRTLLRGCAPRRRLLPRQRLQLRRSRSPCWSRRRRRRASRTTSSSRRPRRRRRRPPRRPP